MADNRQCNVKIVNRPTQANCRDTKNAIELRSYDVDRYVNIIASYDGSLRTNMCAGPEVVKRLRDELIALFPVEAAPVAKKSTPKGAQAYKGNGKHEWEEVAEATQRLRVPGGWIYSRYGNPVFVPVPEVVGYAV